MKLFNCLRTEPERPESSKHRHKYIIPELIDVATYVKTQGSYKTKSGRAKGLVVHYTAGRRERGAQDAINTLKYLASRGLGCLVMDTEGKIYRAKNQDLQEVAFHAGKSFWKGKNGVSYYCMGMEICNAGILSNDGKAWFGTQYKESETRLVTAQDNIKPGRYLKYITPAQEDSLLNFCMWQADVNPEFDIEWVIGHDEIAPTRKSDPGGSLSMTMPEFRSLIRSKLYYAKGTA